MASSTLAHFFVKQQPLRLLPPLGDARELLVQGLKIRPPPTWTKSRFLEMQRKIHEAPTETRHPTHGPSRQTDWAPAALGTTRSELGDWLPSGPSETWEEGGFRLGQIIRFLARALHRDSLPTFPRCPTADPAFRTILSPFYPHSVSCCLPLGRAQVPASMQSVVMTLRRDGEHRI